MKVAIGGPPHSGKTVLMGLLRALLPRDKFVIVEAAPDGEGITGWSFDGDPELVRAVRRKGKFLEEFVDWVCDSVRNSEMPLTLVDLGGMLVAEDGSFSPTGVRLTPQNERIVRECDYLIVIANPNYVEAAKVWADEGIRLGAKPLALLESVLTGADDEMWEAGVPLRARVTKLDRDYPPVGSPTARAVAQLLISLAGEGNGADGSEAANVNFPRLAEGLNLPLRNGGPDRDWFPGIIPQLVAFVGSATADREAVNLWGNCSAGFPYHALACGLPQRIRYYDPKVSMGYVPIPDVEPQGQGSQVLDWRVEERDDYSLVEFVIPRQIFPIGNLPLVIPPTVVQGKGVVISGKGPWWLTGTLARAYARTAGWVAVFTPQESARRDSEGKKWSEKNPGLAPAVVISSSDPAVEVGTVFPFRLLSV